VIFTAKGAKKKPQRTAMKIEVFFAVLFLLVNILPLKTILIKTYFKKWLKNQ